MDTVVRVSNEIEKSLKMKEIMAIIFLDTEKVYEMR